MPGVITASDCARWLARIDSVLLLATTPEADPRGQDSAVRPCSLRLNTLPELFTELCANLQAHAALEQAVCTELGSPRVLLADHCWVRHQPAPRRRRPGQTPHSWHQDGALAFDFHAASPPYPDDALLRMLTCWLPLTPCGTDAPSIEWLTPPVGHLLAPAELQDEAMSARIDVSSATARPPSATSSPQATHAVMAAGDALLFGGATLHRTHATPVMIADRTSVELRWMPADAVPARLAAGRLLRVG